MSYGILNDIFAKINIKFVINGNASCSYEGCFKNMGELEGETSMALRLLN